MLLYRKDIIAGLSLDWEPSGDYRGFTFADPYGERAPNESHLPYC